MAASLCCAEIGIVQGIPSHGSRTDIVIQCLEDGHIATGQCSLLRFDARLSACGIAHQSSGFYKLSDCCCIGRCIGTDIAFLVVVVQSCAVVFVEIALKEIDNIKILTVVKQNTEYVSAKSSLHWRTDDIEPVAGRYTSLSGYASCSCA